MVDNPNYASVFSESLPYTISATFLSTWKYTVMGSCKRGFIMDYYCRKLEFPDV
jgi:hypothetical protein